MKNEKTINKTENNGNVLNLNFDEIELTVIDDAKKEIAKDKTISPFDGLTLDDITFSSTEKKDVSEEIDDSVKSIQKAMGGITEEDLEKQKQRKEFIRKMEEEIDKVFDKLIEEISNMGDTEDA